MEEREKERYLRQIALCEVGEVGQERLQQSSVVIVGVGGLGSPVATLLTSAGVGRIGIIDYDVVGLSNLPRQTLYTTEDIGKSKVECAERRLRAMNPSAQIESYNLRLSDENAKDILSRYDIIVDGCDNMSTRYIIDRASKELGVPYVYGAISGFEGQVSVFNHSNGRGYEELYGKEGSSQMPPPAVMATTPAIIGAMEANEVMKIVVGYGDILAGKLLTFDSRNYSLNIFDI